MLTGDPRHLESPSNAAIRTRELYRYFTPQTASTSTTESPTQSTTLASYAQLVAWRLNCRRAMVSVVDRDTQYFIAESSKTLDLSDNTRCEDPKDVLWAGCTQAPKAGRLCEHTLITTPKDGLPAHFEISDLPSDSRFNQLPFVTGAPNFKYYCGVPLKTKKGISIGSLFILDDKIRPRINPDQLSFLVTMAENCISHLENCKEKDDLKRVKIMNMCLAAFVDPENRVRTGHGAYSASVIPTIYSPKLDSESVSVDPETPVPNPADNSFDPTRTMKNAIGLLYKSLNLDSSSGIVFLDSGASITDLSYSRNSDESSEGELEHKYGRSRSNSSAHVSFKSWQGSMSRDDIAEKSRQPPRPAQILACTSHSTSTSNASFTLMSQYELSKLIKRYPRGMLFNLDEDESSSSDESNKLTNTYYNMPKSKSQSKNSSDTKIWQRNFPQARQVVFIPLWIPSWSRYCAFIAYNTSPYQQLDKDPDFLHCLAFCHCIATEISRVATSASDQQKSDFIGSISHELRSPLHGILASCEFLEDTILSTFQKSLVDTADGCARTLLDTINMVLDYSKINAFERSIPKAKKGKNKSQSTISTSHLQPALNIYGDVDLAAITEEVVEGVATGQVFRDRLGDVDSVDASTVDSPKEKGSNYGAPDVEIILDIASRAWVYLTQPGAFRRVVMNVFGNALKYTSKGFIRVRLESNPAPKREDEDEDIDIITLIIKDTGQGISPQYMKNKLFTPFAQENSIAPGTGLGLSLVRTIVRMLHGEIDIQSTLGTGTTVTIKFPMVVGKSASGVNSASTPSSAGSIERTKDDSLKLLKSLVRGKTATYFATAALSMRESYRLTREVICQYLSKWYGFKVAPLSAISSVDIILAHQSALPSLLTLLEKETGIREEKEEIIPDLPSIVVICSAGSWIAEDRDIMTKCRMESISYPFGPYKLAKILRICLEKPHPLRIPELTHGKSNSSSKDSREEVTEVMQAVEEVNLAPDVKVVQQGQMMANAEFAPMMVEALSAASSRSIEQGSGFPFPSYSEGTSQTLRSADEPLTPKPYVPSNLSGDAITPGQASASSIPLPPTSTTSLTPRAKPRLPSLDSSKPTSTALNNPLPSSTDTNRQVQPTQVKSDPRILLVDDNKVNLRLITTFMQKRGYKDIHVASDGAQALSVFSELLNADPPHPPDIVFMDISMPVMDGFEATRHIRETESRFRSAARSAQATSAEAGSSAPAVPVAAMMIALTGLASTRDQSEAFLSGFDLYLVKPISFKSVAKLLDSWERSSSTTATATTTTTSNSGGSGGSGGIASSSSASSPHSSTTHIPPSAAAAAAAAATLASVQSGTMSPKTAAAIIGGLNAGVGIASLLGGSGAGLAVAKTSAQSPGVVVSSAAGPAGGVGGGPGAGPGVGVGAGGAGGGLRQVVEEETTEDDDDDDDDDDDGDVDE